MQCAILYHSYTEIRAMQSHKEGKISSGARSHLAPSDHSHRDMDLPCALAPGQRHRMPGPESIRSRRTADRPLPVGCRHRARGMGSGTRGANARAEGRATGERCQSQHWPEGAIIQRQVAPFIHCWSIGRTCPAGDRLWAVRNAGPGIDDRWEARRAVILSPMARRSISAM